MFGDLPPVSFRDIGPRFPDHDQLMHDEFTTAVERLKRLEAMAFHPLLPPVRIPTCHICGTTLSNDFSCSECKRREAERDRMVHPCTHYSETKKTKGIDEILAGIRRDYYLFLF